MRPLILAALAVASLAVPAFAQSQSQVQSQAQAQAQAQADLAALKRYVGSQSYVQMLVEAAVGGEMQTAPECKTPKPLDRSEFTIFSPPRFGSGPTPEAGMWRDRLRIDRCGRTGYQNVVFIARPGAAPQSALMLPGLTEALPQMQQSLLPKAAALAQKRVECGGDDVMVVDTTASAPIRPSTRKTPDGSPLDGQWQETWTLRACGKLVQVHAVYTPDGVGGVFSEIK